MRAFGAVFTDVDEPDGSGPGKKGKGGASTLIEDFDVDNKVLFGGSCRLRLAIGACPSSASCLTTRASYGSRFQPATLHQGRMIDGKMTLW